MNNASSSNDISPFLEIRVNCHLEGGGWKHESNFYPTFNVASIIKKFWEERERELVYMCGKESHTIFDLIKENAFNMMPCIVLCISILSQMSGYTNSKYFLGNCVSYCLWMFKECKSSYRYHHIRCEETPQTTMKWSGRY